MHVKQIAAAAALLLTANAFAAAPAPAPDPATAAFLATLNSGKGKPIETLAPEQARAVLAGAQAGAALTPADVSEKTIDVDGKPLKLTIVRPQGASGVLPVFMFFHGGGWILGDFPTHERMVRDLVAQSGAVAVFVNYAPSPEARYPVAIKQAYAATRWVASHGADIGVDGTRLAVVGNSAGGNMATAVALQAQQQGGPRIRYQVLFWPVVDADFETASYRQFDHGYFLSRSMMRWFWDAYAPAQGQRRDILASPLLATAEQLHGLPPALIQTAELDVLRDGGEAYGRKLSAAGVDVTTVRYVGAIHDFGMLNALSSTPAARAALQQAAEQLQQHLK